MPQQSARSGLRYSTVEIIGYINRAIASTQTPDWTLGPFIAATLTLLLAPALYAASIYMELGRIIRAVDGEHQCIIRLRWLTKIFVTGDVFSFLVQSAGNFSPHPPNSNRD